MLFESIIFSHWHGGRKEQAQAASDLLDEANGVLADVEGVDAAAQAAPAPEPLPPPHPAADGKPQLPPETFFLPADAVRQCLTLNIDSSILQLPDARAARRGGWPLGKRRKPDGGGSASGWSGEPCSSSDALVSRLGFVPGAALYCCRHCLKPATCTACCRQAQGAAAVQPMDA